MVKGPWNSKETLINTSTTDLFEKVFSLQSFLSASQKESENPPSFLLLSRKRKREDGLFSRKP